MEKWKSMLLPNALTVIVGFMPSILDRVGFFSMDVKIHCIWILAVLFLLCLVDLIIFYRRYTRLEKELKGVQSNREALKKGYIKGHKEVEAYKTAWHHLGQCLVMALTESETVKISKIFELYQSLTLNTIEESEQRYEETI